MSQCVGTIVGDDAFYAELNRLSPAGEREGEAPRILFAMHDGRDVGYVVFKRTHKWPNSRPAAEVDVRQISGAPAGRLALAPTGRRPRPGGNDQAARRRRVRPPAVVGAGSAWSRRRPPVRQPLGAPRGPAGVTGPARLRSRLRRRRRGGRRACSLERRALADQGQGGHGRRDPHRRRRRGVPPGEPRSARRTWGARTSPLSTAPASSPSTVPVPSASSGAPSGPTSAPTPLAGSDRAAVPEARGHGVGAIRLSEPAAASERGRGGESKPSRLPRTAVAPAARTAPWRQRCRSPGQRRRRSARSTEGISPRAGPAPPRPRQGRAW